jgi:hypothetical protein
MKKLVEKQKAKKAQAEQDKAKASEPKAKIQEVASQPIQETPKP